MASQRILFISQEIAPYLPESPVTSLSRQLPQYCHSHRSEVRIFMPNYGSVNERRNQLHEVIRLSGLNIVINDNDHPLIIKVASLQPSRIQVYFIDNDDYFQKAATDTDPIGSNRDDNDERALFFAHGTAETVKKLRWEPNIIHISGWMSALSTLFLRKMIENDPAFEGTKIIYSVMPGEIQGKVDPGMFEKLKENNVSEAYFELLRTDNPETSTFHKLAINCADAVIFHTENPDSELLEFANKKNIPVIFKALEDTDLEAYQEFYQSL